MLFKSKGKELRLVKTPSTFVFDGNGNVVTKPGQTIQFINHMYRTEDPEIINWLLNHHRFKIEFDVVPEEIVEQAQMEFKNFKPEIETKQESINKDALVQEVAELVTETVLNAIKPIFEKQEAIIRKPKKVWFCADCQKTFGSPLMLANHRKETGHGKKSDKSDKSDKSEKLDKLNENPENTKNTENTENVGDA